MNNAFYRNKYHRRSINDLISFRARQNTITSQIIYHQNRTFQNVSELLL